MQDLTLTDQVAGVDIDGPDNDGPQMGARHKAENQKAESQKAEFKKQKIKWQKNQKAEKSKSRKSIGRKSKGRNYCCYYCVYPLVYVLMTKRTQAMYCAMLRYIVEKAADMFNIELTPRHISTDFEKAAINAFEEVFPSHWLPLPPRSVGHAEGQRTGSQDNLYQ